MIWGEAGVGKTTFCGKFRQDWAIVVKEREGKLQELTPEQKSELEKLTEEQRSKLNNIGLLLSIVLRDIDEGAKSVSVKDIIFSQLGFHREGTFMSQPGLKSQLLYILENVSEHSKLVLLMDGFDEISDKDNKIEGVITGETYQNVHSITTCRPHAIGDNVLNVDVEIRLKGFSWVQATLFVQMFARIEYTKQDQIVTFVKQTMSQIESSADLTEMSTNPSMLQLMCHLLSWNKGKIGKDRTSLLKDYARYLLVQYHIKLGRKVELYSDDLYKQYLLDAGKVALMGLRQNQLQLVFSKTAVQNTCGKTIFDIGFLIELPSTVTDTVKVQFTHKTLQEYLAAFYVVNTRGYKGLQLLMEFCSTSQRMMGSQIILAFISNMSTNILGEKIQKKFQDFISKWDSDDKVNPRNRTSFLISMLEGNEMKFPLPAVVDINFSRYYYFKKSALDRFLDMNGQGVKKITVTLSLKNRLNLLQNRKIHSLDELHIDNDRAKIWSGEDTEDLHGVMEKMKPGLLYITNCDWKLMDKATIDVILHHVHTLILENCGLEQQHLLSLLRREHHLKVLKVNQLGIRIDGEVIEAVTKLSSDVKLDLAKGSLYYSHKDTTLMRSSPMKSLNIHGIEIDTELAETVSSLPDDIQLDLSRNKVTDISACITLIHKDATMKSLNIHDCMSNCGIQVDAEIAEAVSRLPDLTQLDLSGNQVTDKSACITLIHKAATMKSFSFCNCGIQIDTEIAEAVSRLPDDIQLDLSGNKVTDKSACITLIHKAATMESLSFCNCGIQIDTEIAEAISRIPDDTQLDLSGNKVTDKSACITLIHRAATMKSLNICNCGIQIDTEIAEAVSRLPDDKQLDLSGNKVTDKAACISLIHKAATMKSLSFCNCGIQIDTEVAKAVSRLPDDTQLDLSGNKATDKSACITLIHKAATMKSLNICNCCIQIDTEIAEAVYRLPDDKQLDLSGNKVTNKSACITLIHKAATMKSLSLCNCMSNCHIQIDTELAEAVSSLADDFQLDLSGNKVTDKSVCITLLHKAVTMKYLSIYDCISNCGIQIDTKIAETVSRLPDDIQLDLSGNRVTDISASVILIHKALTMKSLNIHNCISNCGMQIDKKIAEAISRLPDHVELDLSGNKVTDKSACITLLHKAVTMKSLKIYDCISNCGIQIDTEIAEAVSRLPDDIQLDLSGNMVSDSSASVTLIHKAVSMKSLNIHNCISNCGMQIDTEIVEAVSRLPDHTELDLSGNKVTDKSACITLIHKAATMKSLILCNCGIQIDTKIAQAVSTLSDHTQLDLSGNEVTDKSACITLIHKAATMKSLSLCNCGIQIDTKIAQVVSTLSDHTQLDLSGNEVTDKSACITLIHKAATMKSLSFCNCGIQIDTEIAEAISRLPDHVELDLSGNKVTDKSACITLLHKAVTMKSLNIYDCISNSGIQIDTKIAEAVSRLPDDIQLDLSGNRVTDISASVTLIHKAVSMKSLNIHNCISNCGIQIDTEIAEAVSRLPDHAELDLSGNKVTDKSACITLIHKAANMESLNIHNCMSNCGIQINTEIAEAVSRLPDHTELDLSGNQVTDKSACITLLHKAATMKSLNIHDCMSNCGIGIDTEIAEAVSRLPDDIQLDLSGNKLTKMDPRLLPGILLHMSEDKKIDMTGFRITIDVDIVKALSKIPQLKALDASNNKLTPEAAREFSMTKLQQLGISYYGINDTVCVSLMISLSKHCPLLEVLDLSYNKLTFDEWCHHVQMKQLRRLYLSECDISNSVCVSLMISLSKHCLLLEALKLSGNKMSSSGMLEIVNPIKHMKNLRELRLYRNPCMRDQQCREKVEELLQKSNPRLKVAPCTLVSK